MDTDEIDWQGNDAERAIEWLFSHPDDSGEQDAEAPASSSTSHGNPTPAPYILKSFISHKGPSIHSGHYVSHVKQEGTNGWVLFNDEKVVKAEGDGLTELEQKAYVYFFQRS